jgi:hypothetical protein
MQLKALLAARQAPLAHGPGMQYGFAPSSFEALLAAQNQNSMAQQLARAGLVLPQSHQHAAALHGMGNGYMGHQGQNFFPAAGFGVNASGLAGVNAAAQYMATSQPRAIGSGLPCILALPEDGLKLSGHQVFLRHQIEAFQATEDDATTHTRGRNKPIQLGQVGIRCRHCAHLPVARRQKGSTYFPASLLGLYQAAQNMSTTHMQCGLCTEMPLTSKQQFVHLLSNKSSSSGAGRPYWAKTAAKLGLVDTLDGIRFVRDFPPGAKVATEGNSI